MSEASDSRTRDVLPESVFAAFFLSALLLRLLHCVDKVENLRESAGDVARCAGYDEKPVKCFCQHYVDATRM